MLETSVRTPDPEKILPTDQGVAAVFSYEGRFFGIPLQQEDHSKFEAVLSSVGTPSTYGCLRDKKVGLVGGKVDDNEDLKQALIR